MMKNLLIIAVVLILAGCGGKGNAPIPPQKTTPESPPGKATLVSPAQNAVCITGEIISDTESAVSFSWDASDNTDSYSLILTNLLTSDSTIQTTDATQLTSTLLRNTPYSWYVVSSSNLSNKTAQGDKWKFYNAGPGVVTYAPFPAEITAPTLGEVIPMGTVDLRWTGSSVNPGTIVNYDIYFGTSNAPTILQSKVTDSFLDGVKVSSGTNYYWKVITRDMDGNTSDSGMSQFAVN